MLLLATKALYYLAQNLTFVLLFAAMFESKQKFRPLSKFLETVVLTCTQFICSGFLPAFFCPIVLMVVFCLISEIENRRPLKRLAIEISFGFAVRETLRMAYSFFSMSICMKVLGTKENIAVIATCSALLLATYCCSLPFIRKLDLSTLSTIKKKEFIGILAFGIALTLGSLGRMQTPYSPANRVYFQDAFFVLIAAFGMLLLSAKLGLLIAYLTQMLAKADSTIHDYGHTVSDLNRSFKKTIRMARDANTTGDFSADLAKEYDVFTDISDGLVGTAEPLETGTGISNLDGIIKYAAEAAHEKNVILGCSIEDKPKLLLKEPGVTKEALQTLLRNLLDNAIHSAAKAKREPHVVQCMMGVTDGGYRIDVYDSGEPFPPGILRDLGVRGNTEDGHGVGMVNVLEMLAQCNASIFITHYNEPLGTGATKCVTIIFDGQAMAHLPREGGGESLPVSISSLLNRNKRKREDQFCIRL